MAEAHPRVLIVDDQDATRYILRRILDRAGFRVEEAVTGGEALQLAVSLPDIIILDVNLPDMLGYEVCRRIKSNPQTANIPVLQISASFVSDESKVQALKEGSDSYLTLPVEPTVLLAQVNALLRLRRAESLSHTSAVQWQATFDALSDGLALAGEDGTLVRFNARFMQILGMVEADLRDRSLAELFEAAFPLSLKDFLARTGKGRPAELPHANRWFRVRYDTIASGPGSESGAILVLNDITEQKKLQESLKLSERLAATGRLAHIIAHEINNPLEAMSNLLYLSAGRTTSDPETNAYLEQANAELLRISRITKQVLAYHRESSRPTPTMAGEILESVLAIFATQLVHTGVHSSTRLRCADAKVLVHPGEIRQVFSNLIANAIDAMRSDGGGTLHIRCGRSTNHPTGTRGVRFVFSDTGTGIPDASLPRIFEAFFTTKEAKGSGIGLWLSGEVLGKHGGHMRVRTRTQGHYRGTLFDVFLPVTQA